MFCFPFFYGKIATEYDESFSLLQMVGNLAARLTATEKALETATSVVNMLSSRLNALTLDVVYIDNQIKTEIDIYNNHQYILRKVTEKIILHATHYIHDCNCDECVCDIQKPDGFICEINFFFDDKFTDITEILTTDDKFSLAWCNDTLIEDMNSATVCIWWDGRRFCAAVGKYDSNE